MKKLLIINSSARITRSVTRHLAHRAESNWRALHPTGQVEHLDVGLLPPPAINEAWIAAAYTPREHRSAEMIAALHVSERLIDQLSAADSIVIGAPVYNFGPPAPLKAYFEQIVRIGRTFDFGATHAEPYVGLLADKPVLIAVSAGSGELQPGGAEFHLNFLEPQITTVLKLVGLTQTTFARVGGQQWGPEHLAQSLAQAEMAVDRWLDTMSRWPIKCNP